MMDGLQPLPDIHRIAVLRASTGLGDHIAAYPALWALRAAYPAAKIVYLGNSWQKRFIDSRPGPVDCAMVVPCMAGVRDEPGCADNPVELDTFFANMHDERFDLAIQMHGGGRNSNPFVLRLGARITAGWCTPDAPRLDYSMPYRFYQNEIMRAVELVSYVGATTAEFDPRIAVTKADTGEAARALPQLDEPYVVLHPGASDVRRRWLPERFAQVADALAQRGLHIVLTGVPSEADDVAAVMDAMASPAISACGKLSLGGLAGLFSRAALVISNDTGPLHLADAAGAPTISIIWCVNLLNWSHHQRTRHWPIPSWITHCPTCGKRLADNLGHANLCAHRDCLVAGVTVDDVLHAAYSLLGVNSPILGELDARVELTVSG